MPGAANLRDENNRDLQGGHEIVLGGVNCPNAYGNANKFQVDTYSLALMDSPICAGWRDGRQPTFLADLGF